MTKNDLKSPEWWGRAVKAGGPLVVAVLALALAGYVVFRLEVSPRHASAEEVPAAVREAIAASIIQHAKEGKADRDALVLLTGDVGWIKEALAEIKATTVRLEAKVDEVRGQR